MRMQVRVNERQSESHVTGAAKVKEGTFLWRSPGIIELTGVAWMPDEEVFWSAAERLALCAFSMRRFVWRIIPVLVCRVGWCRRSRAVRIALLLRRGRIVNWNKTAHRGSEYCAVWWYRRVWQPSAQRPRYAADYCARPMASLESPRTDVAWRIIAPVSTFLVRRYDGA